MPSASLSPCVALYTTCPVSSIPPLSLLDALRADSAPQAIASCFLPPPSERHRLLEDQDDSRGPLDAQLLLQLPLLGALCAQISACARRRQYALRRTAAERLCVHVFSPHRLLCAQIIIFLKLFDGGTSQLILIEMGISTMIEGWKVSRILRQRGMWGLGCGITPFVNVVTS